MWIMEKTPGRWPLRRAQAHDAPRRRVAGGTQWRSAEPGGREEAEGGKRSKILAWITFARTTLVITFAVGKF
ncbi:hypothetical protein CAL29_01195 [Bordetella genomosp. 10]|uniref:Uncharacterized protein n=1 Tax=Bordetella genomosp. 10 TaxID=1416804 RepID=A0A261SJ73_9BORD|nr:hypothetical protein CAL29_01195 [Bordetella genomosp. 10]